MSDAPAPTPDARSDARDAAKYFVLLVVSVAVLVMVMVGVLSIGDAVRNAGRVERLIPVVPPLPPFRACNRRVCGEPHFHLVSPLPDAGAVGTAL